MPAYTISTFRFDQTANGFVKKAVDRELGPDEVLIKTTHSGLCYTDVHAKQSGKGCGLGHEGVGEVLRVGTGVKDLRLGQRVGWGWLHHSCGACDCCADGQPQYCASAQGFAFGELDQGSLGDFAIRPRAFVCPIPDSIPSDVAAPLMCAGASTFEALTVAAAVKPSDRVGVVGPGGLGHVAVQFARAFGCGVTVVSDIGSADRRDDARRLGADEFFALDETEEKQRGGGGGGEEEEGQRAAGGAGLSPINVLLVCANAVPTLGRLLPLLARRARIVLMTIQSEPLVLPYMQFVLPGHSIVASTEASRKTYAEMLRFVERHGEKVWPWTQKFPMTDVGVAEAFATLEGGRMRYRGVLVAEE